VHARSIQSQAQAASMWKEQRRKVTANYTFMISVATPVPLTQKGRAVYLCDMIYNVHMGHAGECSEWVGHDDSRDQEEARGSVQWSAFVRGKWSVASGYVCTFMVVAEIAAETGIHHYPKLFLGRLIRIAGLSLRRVVWLHVFFHQATLAIVQQASIIHPCSLWRPSMKAKAQPSAVGWFNRPFPWVISFMRSMPK